MTRIERPIDAARLEDEWLEADGFGGFASGTAGTLRTRRYHALLLAATRPPTGRVVLVNGVEAWVEANGVRYPLTMQRYVPDVTAPDITSSLFSFTTEPWPTWRFVFDAQRALTVELFVAKATGEAVLRWHLQRCTQADADFRLYVRPLLSGRDYHALHHENNAFDFAAVVDGDRVSWRPYGDLPAIHASANGTYAHAPDWYRNFCYDRERERGLEFSEDLATPGIFTFDLAAADAVLILSASTSPSPTTSPANPARAAERAQELARIEHDRRAAFTSRLYRSADAYVVARGNGRTIAAGFPWFTDWGRDTFIAMRGLLLAAGRYEEAQAILVEWSGTLSDGMLPNRFPRRRRYARVQRSRRFVVVRGRGARLSRCEPRVGRNTRPLAARRRHDSRKLHARHAL